MAVSPEQAADLLRRYAERVPPETLFSAAERAALQRRLQVLEEATAPDDVEGDDAMDAADEGCADDT